MTRNVEENQTFRVHILQTLDKNNKFFVSKIISISSIPCIFFFHQDFNKEDPRRSFDGDKFSSAMCLNIKENFRRNLESFTCCRVVVKPDLRQARPARRVDGPKLVAPRGHADTQGPRAPRLLEPLHSSLTASQSRSLSRLAPLSLESDGVGRRPRGTPRIKRRQREERGGVGRILVEISH